MTTTEILTREDALAELERHDHGILDADFAREIAAPFGVEPRVRTFRTGTGRVAVGPDGAHDQPDFDGVAAHELAFDIRAAVGAKPCGMIGIGSCLRECIRLTREAIACA